MEIYQIVILTIFFSLVLLEILFTNFFNKNGQRTKDGVVEFFSFFQVLFLAQPLAFALAYGLTDMFAPSVKGLISDWSIFVILGLLLIFDDLAQYLWHRLCHSVPILYNLHRPHHDPEYLSIRVVYRNGLFYYLLMPGLWFAGILFYMGSGATYFFYIVIKQTCYIWRSYRPEVG
jgi:sterol desaturase/sphingolipid hydroxylase (fatty acid hydroxylase superfamily)